MTPSEALVEALTKTHNEYVDFNIRYDYSGRGMYGKSCIGIVADHSDLIPAAMFLYAAFVLTCNENEVEDYELGNLLLNVATDGMGRQGILYFPDLSTENFSSDDLENLKEYFSIE